jgi:hypothetical protein
MARAADMAHVLSELVVTRFLAFARANMVVMYSLLVQNKEQIVFMGTVPSCAHT